MIARTEARYDDGLASSYRRAYLDAGLVRCAATDSPAEATGAREGRRRLSAPRPPPCGPRSPRAHTPSPRDVAPALPIPCRAPANGGRGPPAPLPHGGADPVL